MVAPGDLDVFDSKPKFQNVPAATWAGAALRDNNLYQKSIRARPAVPANSLGGC